MDYTVDITTNIGLLAAILIWLSGLITSTAREMKRSNLTFKQYWTVDYFYSIASLFIGIAMILILYTKKEESVFAYFAVGYMIDNFINKAESGA